MTDPGPPLTPRATRDKAEVLAARARLLARPLEASNRDDLGTKLIGFDAGEGRFALPTDSVMAVITGAPPAPLPDQPQWLAGAVPFGGRILTAVEPDRFLGAPPAAGRREGVVTLIILSDGVTEVALLAGRLASLDVATTIEPLPDGTPPGAARVIRGVIGGRHLLDASGMVRAVADALLPSTHDHVSSPPGTGASST